MEGTITLSILGLIKDSILYLITAFKLHSKVLWQDREEKDHCYLQHNISNIHSEEISYTVVNLVR
jgi:hypothetical protein